MSRTRVLRLIARMNVGGPALQVTGLAEGLDRDRFDQRIVVGSVSADEADFLALRAPHVDVVRLPGLGRDPRAGDDVRALRALVAEMRRFRPDILHTHTAKAGTLGRLAAEVARVPTRVHTFHGHLLHSYFSPTITRAVTLTERALAARTDRLVAVGARVRDELLAAGIGRPAQYRVVPPGLDLPSPPSPAEARSALGVPADALVVAFVARLTAVKRPDRFADVVQRVLVARPDVRFVVAGEGDLLDDLRARLAPAGDAVRFLGWRADVETVYAASDLAVLTSDNEGMPVSLIEAGAA
ncbi:MAG TPA: glycosyltransferase, partial [Acidimicrobiales bacterium]|nr:glycosyltransferase [Acidimicrobiales bacterium]